MFCTNTCTNVSKHYMLRKQLCSYVNKRYLFYIEKRNVFQEVVRPRLYENPLPKEFLKKKKKVTLIVNFMSWEISRAVDLLVLPAVGSKSGYN